MVRSLVGRRGLIRALTALFMLTAGGLVHAEEDRVPDWNQWRGPHRNGSSEDEDWEPTWGDNGPRKVWSIQLGDGYSGVAVANGRVYTCGGGPEVPHEGQPHKLDLLYCLEPQSGETVWETATTPTSYSQWGPQSSTTPQVADKVVYMLSRWGCLMAADADSGKRLWTLDLNLEIKGKAPGYGYGCSPLIMGDTLVLNLGDRGMGIDKTNGKVIWKSGGTIWPYPSAVPAKFGKQDVAILLCHGTALVAINPADGTVVWSYPLTQYPEGGPAYSDPIIGEGTVMATSIYGSVLVSLRNGKPTFVAKPSYGAQVCNPCCWKGHLYGFRARDGLTTPSGKLVCIDLKSGKTLWENKDLAGTLIAAGGKLIIQTLRGELIVADASPTGYKEISRATIVELGREDPPMVTAPAISQGKIYCRFRTKLVCLDVSVKKAK